MSFRDRAVLDGVATYAFDRGDGVNGVNHWEGKVHDLLPLRRDGDPGGADVGPVVH